jgi:hypothetical protein
MTEGLLKPTLYGLRVAASVIRILDQRTGTTRTWRLYPHQESVLEDLIEHDKVVILKARQMGISTLCVFYALMLGVLNPAIRVAVVADNFNNSQGLLEKIRDFAKQLNIPLQIDNNRRIVLSNGSSFDAITVNTSLSGDSTAGRSKTFHMLLLSEAAYYRDSHAVFASLTSSTIPGAQIVAESTATPGKTMFRSLWDTSGYHKRFLSMEQHRGYRIDTREISDDDWEHVRVRYGFVDRSSAAFWWQKLNNEFGGEVNRLLREFPVLPQHSWAVASGRWIEVDAPVRTPMSTVSKSKIYCQPSFGGHYIFGVDVSAGVGRDRSSIVVYDLVARQIAAIYSSADDKMPEVAAECKLLYDLFRPINVYIEKNGIGGYWLLPEVRKLGVPATEITTTEASKYSGLLLAKIAVEKHGVAADEVFAEEVANLSFELVSDKEKFSHCDVLMSLSFCLLMEPRFKYVHDVPAPRPPVPEGHWDMERSLKIGERQRRRSK